MGYRKITLILAALLITLLFVGAVQAASVASTFGFILGCDGFEGTISFTADRDNTGFGVELVTERVIDGNGTVLFSVTGPVVVGNRGGANGFAAYNSPPAANPLRYEFFSHAGNGLPEVMAHVEVGSCVGLPQGTYTPPVFTDGRINPQTFAPVVLYCQRSSVSAWSARGIPLMTYNFDAAIAPSSTNTLLHSENGIDLYLLTDGRYAVVATQSDGKQYQFVFAGCPNVGLTEVFVSNPATGEFIRAQ